MLSIDTGATWLILARPAAALVNWLFPPRPCHPKGDGGFLSSTFATGAASALRRVQLLSVQPQVGPAVT